PLPPRAVVLRGLGEDLVVDVGDVTDERDVIALGEQPAAQDIEGHTGTHVPDVRDGLHGGATQVDGNLAFAQRGELADLAARGVVNAQLERHRLRSVGGQRINHGWPPSFLSQVLFWRARADAPRAPRHRNCTSVAGGCRGEGYPR